MGRSASSIAAARRATRGSMGALGCTALALAGFSWVGCHRVFTCADDEQCGLRGTAGVCETDGYCSFPDSECASGRRYGEHAAASRVGTCVEGDSVAGSESGSPDTGGPTTASASASGSGDGHVATASSSSSSSSASSSSGVDTSFDPCEGLLESGAVSATAPGQVIAGLRITVDEGPAIEVDGVAGVTIRDCEIHHRGGPGISFAAAPDLRIENVVVIHDGAPAAGPHADGAQANIEGRDSSGVLLDHVRVTRGSSGIDLESTPGVQLAFVEAHDIRGPGAGACVRLFDSDGAVLEDFSCENPLDTGRPGDLVAIAESSDVTVRRGLLDGHNAEFGYGVHFIQVSGQHSGGLVEDVDAIRMTNGSFSCFPYGEQITFRRTRARQNICEIVSVPIEGCDNPGPNGGCIPGSGGVSWASSHSSTTIVIEDSVYFDLCAPTVWPAESLTIAEGDLVEADFEPRAPIRVEPCWETP